MIRYLHTSAALKLIVEEAESQVLAEELSSPDGELVSSMLLFTELHCAAERRAGIPVESVTAVVDALALIDLQRADLQRAATSRWGLRSADAIHLACALRVEAAEIVTYDHEMQEAARAVGLGVLAPGS